MTWQERSDRTLVRDLKDRDGATVTLLGRLVARRDMGGVAFADLLDRTGLVQLVLPGGMATPALQSVIRCSGVVAMNERAPRGVEVQVAELDVLSAPQVDLPFNPESLPSPCTEGGPKLETLLDHREVSLRSTKYLAVVRIASEILAAADDFLRYRDFVEVKTPKLVSGGTEGGAGLFEVKYFERSAFLAQSPQLYKQTMASTPLERVFEVGPVFRAEKHATGRHLNEFTGIDVEIAYPNDLRHLLSLIEGLVRAMGARLAERCQGELDMLGTKLPVLGEAFPVIDLDTAKEIATGQRPTRSNPAEHLSAAEEQTICEWALREHGSEGCFVTEWPTRFRPFYSLPCAGNRKKSETFDLLLRGLEMSSGGLRQHDAAALEEAIGRQGLDPAAMEPYLRVFRTGCPPHGGFGLGLERLVQKFLDLPNVRCGALFPRDRNRLAP